MKVINNLLNYNNLKIVQDNEWFMFSLDSVLLANFPNLKKKDKVIDFCTGNAPIPLFISNKLDNKIIGVELQKEVYELALESVKINNLEDKINIINEDVKNIDKLYETDTFDVIFCNPPYFKLSDENLINQNKIKALARHELSLTLDDIFKVSKKILKNNGKLLLVHKTDRLSDIINKLRLYNLEPKIIRFVYPKENTESNMVLIEARKNAKPGLKVLCPLIAHNLDGSYSQEVKKMFEGDQIEN